jgi:N-acetylglucosamine-6-phosphate deacetylase
MTVLSGTIVLPDRLISGSIHLAGERISAIVPEPTTSPDFLCPGFIDLHVHGGDDADFMDATPEAFRTICHAHARHGTTALLPTTTVASHEEHLAFLEVCRSLQGVALDGADVLGAHFYGPFFTLEARGCHPANVRIPEPAEYERYLEFGCIVRATVAPELPGAEPFVRACRARGVGCNAGHSHATFAQVEQSLAWGISHVDHLFCAMSDRARLRLSQTFPMRGGLMEATLFFDELTTEVIADGKHLADELLRLAYRIKGADRLALVTDANRALDRPDGEYVFGSLATGERILRRDGVGLMPDGKALASGVMGMDAGVRVMLGATKAPLWEVVRMASLTPARIAGVANQRGSLEVGKRADIVVLDGSLHVRRVFVGGREVFSDASALSCAKKLGKSEGRRKKAKW